MAKTQFNMLAAPPSPWATRIITPLLPTSQIVVDGRTAPQGNQSLTSNLPHHLGDSCQCHMTGRGKLSRQRSIPAELMPSDILDMFFTHYLLKTCPHHTEWALRWPQGILGNLRSWPKICRFLSSALASTCEKKGKRELHSDLALSCRWWNKKVSEYLVLIYAHKRCQARLEKAFSKCTNTSKGWALKDWQHEASSSLFEGKVWPCDEEDSEAREVVGPGSRRQTMTKNILCVVGPVTHFW